MISMGPREHMMGVALNEEEHRFISRSWKVYIHM